MKIKVIDIDGKKMEDVEISDKIFSLKPSRDIIQSVLETQLNKMKKRTAKTKPPLFAYSITSFIILDFAAMHPDLK